MPTYSNISIVITTNLSYVAGDFIQVNYDANNYIVGEVISYVKANGNLTLRPTLYVGTGTFTSWNVNLTGADGTSGTSGTSGTAG